MQNGVVLTCKNGLGVRSRASLVEVQCDRSQASLGVVLMQDAHPMAYASRTFRRTEPRYIQTKKDRLAFASPWSGLKTTRLIERQRFSVTTSHWNVF